MWTRNKKNKIIDEYSKTIGGISFHASKDLAEALSTPQIRFDQLVLDMISFCLLLTYQGIKQANLPDNMYKETLQGIARNLADIIAEKGKTEEEYSIIMTAFQDFSQIFATSDSRELIENTSRGFIEKYSISKQEDFIAHTHTTMILSNIANSLNAKAFVGSLR